MRFRTLTAVFAALIALLCVSCGFNADDPLVSAPVVSLDDPPPPIAGGTLLATRDGRFAVAADPDRHRVVVVTLATREVRVIPVEPGAEPGRLAEDVGGRVFVALRRGGAVLAIDPAAATVAERYPTCASPRGLASEGDRLHVACADGTLVTLDAAGAEVRTVRLGPDLRDVVPTPDGLVVSRFRSASLDLVDTSGAVAAAPALPEAELASVHPSSRTLRQRYAPGVAVRLAPAEGGALVLHQRARVGVEAVFAEPTAPAPTTYTYSNRSVSDGERTWEDPCENAVVHAAATLVDGRGEARHVALPVRRGVVPVDAAVSARGDVLLAFAGEPGADYGLGPQVVATSTAALASAGTCLEGDAGVRYPGQVVAVAFAGEIPLVQLREPARLVVDGEVIELGGASVRDTGHDVFHLDTGGAIACASCHPGGGDDGHVWTFAARTAVRTPGLEGVIGRAPYHRAGDVESFDALMRALEIQMDRPALGSAHVDAAERWLERLPPAATGPAHDPDAIGRGLATFEAVGCAECHAGERGTDGRVHDVGGERWKTPPLRGIALRAPYLHDGIATTIREAITLPAAHADVEVPPEALDDLAAYVASR